MVGKCNLVGGLGGELGLEWKEDGGETNGGCSFRLKEM